MNLYEFPYDKVPHASCVIIYGAGEVGQTYMKQIMKTKYCNLECMVDKKYAQYKSLPVEVCEPSEVLQKKYDLIVIANSSPRIAAEIKECLIEEYGVPKEKIIYENRLIEPIDVIYEDDLNIADECFAYAIQGKIPVAINLIGGFGDYIVRKENVKELTFWDKDIVIDIYVGDGKESYTKILFSDIGNLNLIIASTARYKMNKRKYVASFRFSAFMAVDYLDEIKMENLPKRVKENLHKMQIEYLKYGLNEMGISYSVHYARCQKDGLNCYTSYNRYGVFNVKKMSTTIPLLKEYEAKVKKMKLSNYITLNYGWDSTLNVKKPPAKVWPVEYYEMLVKLIRKRYPQIAIVQIGLKDSLKIKGCTSYVFGENIEFVKYVLRDSKLHIDCEGGMVHLATQLGTKCAVLFGPTPIDYYGYKNNINIVGRKCRNCCWFIPDCFSCYRGLDKPECMYSLLPDMVAEKISPWLALIGN